MWSVEEARAGDADGVLAVTRRAFSLYRDKYAVPPDPLRETIDEVRADIDRGDVWVARDGERVVGAVRVREREGAHEIYGLAVDPDYSRLDVGESLVRAAEERLRQRGARRIQLCTGLRDAPAIEFWYRFGYRPFRLEPDPQHGYDRVWFEKSL